MAACSTHATVIARVKTRQKLTHSASIFHHRTQVRPGANFAACHFQLGFFKTCLDEEVFEGGLVLDVLRGLAARDLIERRLGDIDMAALDQFRHLPEEEG